MEKTTFSLRKIAFLLSLGFVNAGEQPTSQFIDLPSSYVAAGHRNTVVQKGGSSCLVDIKAATAIKPSKLRTELKNTLNDTELAMAKDRVLSQQRWRIGAKRPHIPG